MRKLITTVAILFFTFNVHAQYKKASFFDKEGRTYELGSQVYVMGEGNGNPIGYKISFGRDRDGKKSFKSWNIQFIPSHKYNYTTEDDMGNAISVTGNSANTFVYGFDWGFHVLKNEAENRPMIQPFVSTGFNILILGGMKNEIYSPDPIGYAKRNTSDQSISIGFNGSLGCFVNLNSKWALKVQGGYSHQLNFSSDHWDDYDEPFYAFDSHFFAGLGLRLRIVKD